MSTRFHSVFLLALCLLTRLTLAAPDTAGDPQPELLTIDSGAVKIGIDRARGASITYLSWAAYPKNVVNINDPGRLIQQSYYAGKRLDRREEGQHEAWSPWSWNPIQGGGVGSWAKVTRFEKVAERELIGETVPKLWDMPDEEAAAVMRQVTSFEPGMPDVVVVCCELEAKRTLGDRWGPARVTPQEVPATYFTRNFDTFKSYQGSGRWREEKSKPGPPWGRLELARNAMACFDRAGQGIAIFSPSASSWNYGPHAAGKSDDPLAAPCVHIAPVARAKLGPRSTYKYRYWLVMGTEATMAARLDQLWDKYSEERAELSNPQ
jgi:hypothetical protein